MRIFLNVKFIVGAACLAIVLFVAAFGEFITPHGALDQDLLNSLQPPASTPIIITSAPITSAATSSRAWSRARACRC
jgi:hypothetical protein